MTPDVLDESPDGPLKMRNEVATGRIGVFAHARLEDTPMLPPSELDGTDLGKIQTKIRLHLSPEGRNGLPEKLLIRTRAETVVKLPVEMHPFGRREIWTLHLCENPSRSLCGERIHPFGGALYRDPLKRDPDLEDLFQRAPVEGRNPGAALRIQNHEAFRR